MFFTFNLRKKKLIYSFIILLAMACAGVLFKLQAVRLDSCQDCLAIATQSSELSEQHEDNKTVYLTFDDGPSPTTEKILDVLKEKNVKATFFVISDENTKPYFPLLTRAESEGHLVALHSATHKYNQIYKSPEAFWDDLNVLKNDLTPFVTNIPNILRFPGGSTNTVSKKYGPVGLMDTLKAQALDKGYLYVDWNICVNDSVGGRKSREDIVRAATKVGEKKTCIVLFHDSKINTTTADALPEIIDWYKQAGFSFNTVAALNSKKVAHE